MHGHAIRAVRKFCLFVAVLGLAVPAVLASAPPAEAAAQIVRTRTVTLPLSGVISGGSEEITVTGRITVTVVTRTNPGGGGTARFVSTLRNTRGVGLTTGGRYLFVGADTETVAYPPGPITPLTVFPTFLRISPFFPPGPIVPPNPITFVRVLANVTGTGVIDSISADVYEPES